MSESLIKIVVICATAVIISVIFCLALIAETHDGQNESTIIVALIGFATSILTAASAIGGHWQGRRGGPNSTQQP